ncbi:MAG: hypothetical protein IV100_21820 [Myxococcales bacterium]|nr:hypothetical protein [Myxococcales bacterium]
MAEVVSLTGLDTEPRAGYLARALHEQYGVPADSLGAVRLSSSGISLTLTGPAARRLLTPCPLQLADGSRGVLRRTRDLPGTASEWALHLAGPVSESAGAIAAELARVAHVTGEDVLAIRRTRAGVTITLSTWRYREVDLPTSLFGRPVVVEKKNSDEVNGAESGADALATAIRGGLGHAEAAADTIRRVIAASRGDEPLVNAVRRLRERGLSTDADAIPTTDLGLLLLTQSAARPARRRRLAAAFRTIPFPSPAEQSAGALLADLEFEDEGRLPPRHGLGAALDQAASQLGARTAAWGTLLPGRSASGTVVAVAPEADAGDSLLSRWLVLMAQLATGAASRAAFDDALNALDSDVREQAGAVGLDLDGWQALLSLIGDERDGRARLRPLPLEALVPGSERWTHAVVRGIDGAVHAGKVDVASRLAREAFHAVDPAAVPAVVARRNARLNVRKDGGAVATDDPVVLVHVAESLYRQGNRAAAGNAFEAAAPDPGAPAARHAAARLAALDRLQAAGRLCRGATSDWSVEQGAVADEAWERATEAWARRAGGWLGLIGGPAWLDASVVAQLSTSSRAICSGDLDLIASGPVREQAQALLVSPLHSDWASSDAVPSLGSLAMFWESPNAGDVLLAAAREVETGKPVTVGPVTLRRMARELAAADWRPEHARALVTLLENTRDVELAKALGSDLLFDWLDGNEVIAADVAAGDAKHAFVAAAEAVLGHPARAADAAPRLEHLPSRRLERAFALIGEDRMDDAVATATSLLKRAAAGPTRAQSAAVLAIAGAFAPLEAGLDARPMGPEQRLLAFDILVGCDSAYAGDAVPAELHGALQRLILTGPSRLRAAARALLGEALTAEG